MYVVRLLIFGFAVCVILNQARASSLMGPSSKVPNPDFTMGEKIPDGASHDWNLGPIGVRGWMHSNGLETTEARQVVITEVAVGSPADGLLEPGDVILGVASQPFRFDPRTEIGQAISGAEASDGRLGLIRWRDGKQESVFISLPVLGRYSRSAPFDCEKSAQIFRNGCAALARRIEANPSKGNPIERTFNALALLASGDPQYLPLVRAQVELVSDYSDLERRSYHSWWYGPINMLMAEYVLATGDRTFMPDLERITMEIVRGQSEVGSWGHRFVQSNGRLAGYGMMNAPGLPLSISLVLAREAGVESPELDEAIDKSARLIRFYVDKGSVPYGDHRPWIEMHEDNGKNGAAAMFFNLLGDVEAATYFSRMSVASHGAERDTGHTGNYFNMLWAMPGVALSGSHATGAWMEEFGWYFDLARSWDGTYVHQGPPQRKPDSYGGWDATGVFLLAYAQPLNTIYLTGRKPSIVPEADRRSAELLIADGRDWGPRTGLETWAERSDERLFRGLKSWSPVVRERSAIELARRDSDPTPVLRRMLLGTDLDGRIGACQAAIMLKDRAASLVPALRVTLEADDLWLRIKAAEALAAIGDAAMPALPELLAMLTKTPGEADPRGMQQRYLCLALFDRRDGMLGRSLEGVDPKALQAAVVAGLKNEDGRARGAIGSVYRNLSYDAIEPLLPVIHAAIVEPAPSGIMFGDVIRLAGLEVFAEHKIAEGLPLSVMLIDPDRWGADNRIRRCLDVIRIYGGAARPEIARLKSLPSELAANGWKAKKIDALGISELILEIEEDVSPAPLRPLEATRQGT